MFNVYPMLNDGSYEKPNKICFLVGFSINPNTQPSPQLKIGFSITKNNHCLQTCVIYVIRLFGWFVWSTQDVLNYRFLLCFLFTQSKFIATVRFPWTCSHLGICAYFAALSHMALVFCLLVLTTHLPIYTPPTFLVDFMSNNSYLSILFHLLITGETLSLIAWVLLLLIMSSWWKYSKNSSSK